MNIIKVKDYDSMQAITVSLARNGYLVTAESVTDEHYTDHWEIKYCEFSEMTEKPNNNDNIDDFDGDYLGSMEIHNKDDIKGVKCKILQDEKPLVENEERIIEINDPNPYAERQRRNELDILTNKHDTSDNITDNQTTVITSASGN